MNQRTDSLIDLEPKKKNKANPSLFQPKPKSISERFWCFCDEKIKWPESNRSESDHWLPYSTKNFVNKNFSGKRFFSPFDSFRFYIQFCYIHAVVTVFLSFSLLSVRYYVFFGFYITCPKKIIPYRKSNNNSNREKKRKRKKNNIKMQSPVISFATFISFSPFFLFHVCYRMMCVVRCCYVSTNCQT